MVPEQDNPQQMKCILAYLVWYPNVICVYRYIQNVHVNYLGFPCFSFASC